MKLEGSLGRISRKQIGQIRQIRLIRPTAWLGNFRKPCGTYPTGNQRFRLTWRASPLSTSLARQSPFRQTAASWEGEVGTFTDVANPWCNACFRHNFPGILIEVGKDGYTPCRGYLPLPAAERDVADLGAIRLKAKQEQSE